MITANTKMCCLIGDPVDHSLSPLIHNAAYEQLALDFIYLAFNVPPQMLSKAINGLRAIGFKGANITMPHKVDVIKLLDEVDIETREIGAVNTIVNSDGSLKGYNTDGSAAVDALKSVGVQLSGIKLAVLGAGGAARAICFAAAQEYPSQLLVVNRGERKAILLAEKIENKFGITTKHLPLRSNLLKRDLAEADVVINATSVGMNPDTEESVISPRLLKRDAVLMDIVYNPLETRLLTEAKHLGLRTVNGLHMLVNQAAKAFEMWTGMKPPSKLMMARALGALQDRRVR